MSNIKMRFICLLLASTLSLTGCLKTEGTLELKGKVIDEYSKILIPDRKIIIQAEIENNNKTVTVDCGQFTTDSSGLFSYTLRKVKDAYYYYFYLVGDSNYGYLIRRMGLFEINENAKYLFFNLSKLTDLRININGAGNSSTCDTLYLNWESEKVNYKILYPFEVENYGVSNNYLGQSYLGLIWIGKNTRSIVKTRVLAGKMTRLKWELIRNNRRYEVKDTITCKRDIINSVYFKF